MTLIAAYNSSGCTARCDAKCYNAQLPTCTCICRGSNHGKGITQARMNTSLLFDSWAHQWQLSHPDHRITNQQELFTFEET